MCCFRWCGRQLCLRDMPISAVNSTPRPTAVYASDPASPRRPQDSLPSRLLGFERTRLSLASSFQLSSRTPHCALLFASPQGLWGLSCRSGFRRWSDHSVAIEQLQSLIQPSPTPPRPAEALSVPSSQNFQDVSAFALTYILRLRSCKSMDAFVISSLPSLWSETLQTAGLLRSTGVIPPHRYSNPSVTLSPSIDFPVEPVIRSTLLRRFRAGTRRASPVARHVLATVLSLPPRRSEGAASVRFRLPHAAFALRLRTRPSGLRTFEATFAFTVVTAR